MYNQGTVYISKKYDVYELLANEDDEKLMELVADGEIEKYESVEFREDLKEEKKLLCKKKFPTILRKNF